MIGAINSKHVRDGKEEEEEEEEGAERW